MKINFDKGVGIKSNINSEKKIQMKINPDMGMLLVTRYLYSNPIQTLVQEYICNARDATRAAKKETPIEVTLPTKLDPTLKIRDFGQGINDDLMENVFCILGESEKRESNELTGGFGIGAKSGWAYTDSFLIRSIVDGFSKLYLAHLGEGKGGTLEVVSSFETTEPNGVEIQINVQEKDIPDFHNAVYRATQFWDVKPIIKGLLPEEISNQWKSLNPLLSNENWAIYKTSDLPKNIVDYNVTASQIILAVDKIPYRLNNSLNELSIVKKIRWEGISDDSNRQQFPLRHNVTLVVFVNNNDVEVAANREELNNNNFSKEKIENILTAIYYGIFTYQKQKEESIKSVIELIEFQKNEINVFGDTTKKVFQDNGITYSIDKLCFLTAKSDNFDSSLIFDCYSRSNNRSTKSSINLRRDSALNFRVKKIDIYIKDTKDGKNLTREKIKSLLTEPLPNHYVYVLDRQTSSDKEKDVLKFLEKALEIKLLSSINLPSKIRAKSTRPSSNGKIVIHQLLEGQSHSNQLIEKTIYLSESGLDNITNQKWLFIKTNGGKKQYPKITKKIYDKNSVISNSTIRSIIPLFLSKGYKLCTVTEKQSEKLKKFSNFSCFDSFVTDTEKNMRLTNEEEKKIRSDRWDGLPHWIYVLKNDIKLVSDNSLEEMIEYDEKIRLKQAIKNLPYFIEQLLNKEIKKIEQEIVNKNEMVSKIKERYPLAEIGNKLNKNDLLIYINAKYKELKKID